MSGVEATSGVRLSVGGEELSEWVSYEVESDLLTPADAFSLTAANVDGELAGRVKREDEVKLTIEGEQVLVGAVDEVTYDGDEGGGKLQIAGRDLGRFLTDCSAKPSSSRGGTLLQLAKKQAGQWISEWVTSGTIALPQIKRSKVEPGDSVWEYLSRHVELAKALLWIREDGAGVIGRPNYLGKPVFSLYRYKRSNESRCKNNIIRGGVTESSRELFTKVTVVSQVAAGPKKKGIFSATPGKSIFGGASGRTSSKLSGSATSDAIAGPKVKVMTGQALNRAQAKLLAEEHRDRALFEAWKAVYTVSGHTNSGELWRTNALCTLVDEVAGIEGGTYFVTRRRFTKSASEGTRTEVELHPKGIWLK